MINKSAYNILIVEDNIIIALDMKRSLENIGFIITDIVTKLSKVSNSIKKNKPDVAIIDINLHGNQHGIEIGKYLLQCNIPFIYLTSYSDNETINTALETNPICYLIKPYHIKELRSNILLGIYKFEQSYRNKEINIGSDYFYDFRIKKLFYENQIIPLTKNETIIIEILIEAEGKIVFMKELESKVWKDKFIKESTLRTLIYRLRLKLPKDLIQTIPNIGFKLIQE